MPASLRKLQLEGMHSMMRGGKRVLVCIRTSQAENVGSQSVKGGVTEI